MDSNNYLILHHIGYLATQDMKDYNLGVKGVNNICKIDLPLTPGQVSVSNTANYAQQTILSRSAPVYSYVASGPRQLNVTLKVHREMMDDMDYSSYSINSTDYKSLSTVKEERGSLEVLTECLELAVVPTYTDSTIVIPPKVTLKIENIKVTGVVRSVQTVYELPVVDGRYQVVSQTLSIDEIDPYDSASILRLGGYRGL